MGVLDAPEPEHASETARQPRGSASPKRTMRREFTEFEDEQDDLNDDGRRSARRRQGEVRIRVRGGMPRSLGGKIGVLVGVLVLMGLCVGGVMVARTAILHDDRFVIPSSSSIEIQGNQHVTRAQLLSIFGEDVERNIFRVSLDDRKEALEQLPWVEHATVMRLLPNRLRVSIVERMPVAFVRQGNHIGLVDSNGVLLDMPTDVQANMHYSFPVVTGLAQNDPLSLRAARMKLYARFKNDLDSSGEKISEKLSEVDLSNPEDVRAVIPDKGGEVMVHFGEDNFLERYRKFEDHLAEWRAQYPHLSSVDMRYERQVVLEMQPGTTAAAPVTGGDAATPKTVAPVVEEKRPAAVRPATTAPAHPTAAPKKPAAKVAAKTVPAKKPATVAKSTAHGSPSKAGTSTSGQPAKVSNESFWVHPPKKGAAAADQGPDTNVKYHPPQVVHP
jgi:cell division protein FtsQ